MSQHGPVSVWGIKHRCCLFACLLFACCPPDEGVSKGCAQSDRSQIVHGGKPPPIGGRATRRPLSTCPGSDNRISNKQAKTTRTRESNLPSRYYQ
ncbi:hypothetical protein V8C37DRAFT_390022 [Trichoderma ceciliae]